MVMTPEQLKGMVFPGESGGDYNALFGYANRPGGQFAGVNLTDMTVDQALQFAAPSGAYGQSVKGQIGRVATPMGAYQIVGTTLRAAKDAMGLTGNERMTPETQDRIGMWIYQNQGPGAWEAWGKGGGGGGSASSGSNSGGGTMPMGLFDMQEQPPQTFGERLRAGMRSGSLIDSLALAANSLRDRPDQNIAQIVQGRQDRRDEKATVNRTAAWLASQGRDDLAQAMLAGGLDPRAAVAEFYKPVADTRLQDLQIEKAQIELDQLQSGINKDPDVQSSQPLPDQSGVVITLRDGSVQVKTVGGETLRGQAAVDYVRQSQDRSAEYQRSIYGARREGTLGADVVLGQEAAAAGARGTEIGQAQGAAIAGAPVDLATADTTLQYIGEIRNHPGLDIGTGATSIANIVPGTPGYDFQNRLNQLLSGGFLTAIDQLRGMGALSNTEGQTATRAISRMDSATSKEEFLAALNDYETVVSAGRSRAATRMEGQQSPQVGAQQGGAPVTPPAPTGGGGTRLKFNPATGEFE